MIKVSKNLEAGCLVTRKGNKIIKASKISNALGVYYPLPTKHTIRTLCFNDKKSFITDNLSEAIILLSDLFLFFQKLYSRLCILLWQL